MLEFDASIDIDAKCEGTLRFGGCDIQFVKCCPNNPRYREIFLFSLEFIYLYSLQSTIPSHMVDEASCSSLLNTTQPSEESVMIVGER